MAKKKKSRARKGLDTRGYGQTNPKQPSSSATTVTTSKKTHDELEKMLEWKEKHVSVIPASSSVASDRFVKRLTNVYTALTALDFELEQIQQVVVAVGYNITLETALDWLCLHLDSQDLPPLFTDGKLRDEETSSATTGLSVLVAPNKKNSSSPPQSKDPKVVEKEKQLLKQQQQEEEAIRKRKARQQKEEAKKAEEEERSRRDWLLSQYQYEEGDHEEEGDKDDNQADPKKSSAEDKGVEPIAEQVEKSSDQVEPPTKNEIRLKEMEAQLQQEESDLNDEASNYMRSKHEIKDMKKRVGMLKKQVQGLRAKVERERAARAAERRAVEIDANDDNDEDGFFGGGLFSVENEETTEDSPHSPVVVVPPEDRPPPIQYNIPKSWTGKTPMKVLEEWCRKSKCHHPRYAELSDHGCRLTVQTGRSQDATILIRHDGPFTSFRDAQEHVATEALYQIDPSLPLNHIFPPDFADLWMSWVNREKEEKTNEEQKILSERKAIIDGLLRSIPVGSSEIEPQSHCEKPSAEEETMHECSNELPPSENVWDDSSQEDEAGKRIIEPTKTGLKLGKEFSERQATAEYKAMLSVRSGLPMHGYRDQFLQTVSDNPVTILCAETGAGKTTQCPAFLLEQFLLSGRGDRVSILCTQPRRVAATSVSERVAEEMCEPRGLGDTVGYQIRMESKRSSRTKLLFCTTGVVVRRLQEDPKLEGVTHVIVDEVHERQYHIDVLLIALRRLIATSRPDLKVILMSATLDSELFCSFFNGAPLLSIPGRTFPVDSYHLEDLIDATDHMIEEGSQYARREQNDTRTASLWVTSRGGEKRKETVSLDSELDSVEVSDHYAGYKMSTRRSMERVNEEIINYDLIEDVLSLLLLKPESNSSLLPPENADLANGSVLIFLPGIGEIRTLVDRLSNSRSFGVKDRFEIIPMHSTLSPADQRRAFHKPRRGCRKIIVSTNICETSVTIGDVVCVIDCGLVREIRQNKRTSTSTLVTDWCARANTKQRAGRAGRVQPGICCKLFSSRTEKYVMKEASEPELRRVPLEEVCLSILASGFASNCMDFLCQAPQPPAEVSVQAALQVLVEVGAIETSDDTREERLTPLGYHLSKLPVHVRVGKMLVFGALFDCLDKVLTVAAFLSCQTPFVSFVNNTQEVEAQHRSFAHPDSDFLTLCNVWSEFSRQLQEGSSKARRFCKQKYLKYSALLEIRDTREHFVDLLSSIGFLKQEMKPSTKGKGKWNTRDLLSSPWNSNSDNPSVVHAVLAAGLYPNVAHLVTSPRGDHALWHKQERIHFHPSSTNAKPKGRGASAWVLFHEKFGTARRVTISTTCFVHPVALLIFGGTLTIRHTERMVVVDDWIELGIAAKTAVMFRELRKRVDTVLEKMIRGASKESTRDDGLETEGQEMVDGIISLLSSVDSIT